MTVRIASVRRALACGVGAALTWPAGATGQQGAPQAAVPLVTLPAATATTTNTVGAIRGIRHLPDGRVLVNDALRRQLVVYDASLANFTVIIDSTPGAANSYPRTFTAPLIPYLGDSTLFMDYGSQSFLVIDGTGKIAHVSSAPKPSDLSWMSSGSPGVDAKGRLLYQSYVRTPPPISSTAPPPAPPDSSPIVRGDWDTGQVDTIAKFKIPTGSRSTTKVNPDGTRSFERTINPLSWMDDWAVTSEGMLAIVRGQDYHVDFFGADGKRVAAPKMPFDWRHLLDPDKQAIVDSVKHFYDSLSATPNGGMRTSSVSATGVTTTTTIPIKYSYAPLTEIPDYYPPVRGTGSVIADRDGNVWILPYTSAQGGGKGLVYDMVNNKGELVQRVQLPDKRSIAGFGKGGIIYMMAPAPTENATDRPGSAGFFLERTVLVPAGGTIKQ